VLGTTAQWLPKSDLKKGHLNFPILQEPQSFLFGPSEQYLKVQLTKVVCDLAIVVRIVVDYQESR
jgi:hypothetical protein